MAIDWTGVLAILISPPLVDCCLYGRLRSLSIDFFRIRNHGYELLPERGLLHHGKPQYGKLPSR